MIQRYELVEPDLEPHPEGPWCRVEDVLQAIRRICNETEQEVNDGCAKDGLSRIIANSLLIVDCKLNLELGNGRNVSDR